MLANIKRAECSATDNNMNIQITSSKDSLMWYANHIGRIHEVIRECNDYYWCKDHSGRLNIVFKYDAKVLTNRPI